MPRLKLFGNKTTDFSGHRPDRPRVLFVSHEATRTGAPRIILNLLKQFHFACDVNCETILHDDGQLLDEFQRHSEVHHLYLPRRRSTELQKRIRGIVRQKRKNLPLVALCNSMESRFVAEQLAESGVPVIALVHEMPCSYSDSDYRLIYQHAARIVFPAQAVRDASDRKIPVPPGKDLVAPQGLLDPEFGNQITRNVAHRQIRNELSLPPDAFVVLGCGTLDMRKGIDHFAAIARTVVRRNHSETPIHFVWIGDGPRWPHSAFHYVQIDLKNSRATGYVHFIGEREDVEQYFVGSDLFLLSSRVDPFPCVVHEAMAAKLPVMTFEESGGASHALTDGGGFVVPYADFEQAANMICSIAGNPAMADSMRQKSLARVRNEYRFETYADYMITLAESLSGRMLRRTEKQTSSDSEVWRINRAA